MARLSGLQREVHRLYRAVIRTARTKEEPFRERIVTYAREEIEKNKAISKRNVLKIEFLIRRGSKQLQHLQEDDSSCLGITQVPVVPTNVQQTSRAVESKL